MKKKILAATSLLLFVGAATAAGAPQIPKEPATVDLDVAPEKVGPGEPVRLTVRLSPKPGILINRYPKIKLTVPEQQGVARKAEVAVGNDAPPPPDRLDDNYYDTVDPVRLDVPLAPGIGAGTHQLNGTVRYFYCVKASGFCTKATAKLKIPVTVGAN